MATWSAADFIHQRAANKRAAEQLPYQWKWMRYSLYFYLASLIVFPVLTYLILAVLIP
ncbi:hypothetical protein ABS767_15245 [Sphingomonas sp. ST-64]|uniref:Uncharacterized protein n=1 Tax=Sphingomonas plantiphila TaxID=3163295 RepID=A0ABW8YT35_9SPHN